MALVILPNRPTSPSERKPGFMKATATGASTTHLSTSKVSASTALVYSWMTVSLLIPLS